LFVCINLLSKQILSYFDILLDAFVSCVFQNNVLSVAMVQRIHGFCSIPIFLISCFSVFCFFGGKDVSYLFFERLIVGGKYNVGYVCCGPRICKQTHPYLSRNSYQFSFFNVQFVKDSCHILTFKHQGSLVLVSVV